LHKKLRNMEDYMFGEGGNASEKKKAIENKRK
jgi:hypothetical protein